ncbi:MAG: metalloregulator ArsR/SmtB family transcription factor [Thermodesulfobacteriota bacterium]
MTDERLDMTFWALAHPVRRDILARLRRGPAPVTGLAASYRLSLPSISRHLDVLERAGLISRTADGRTRVCAVTRGALDEALGWLSEHRQFWTASLDALAAHVEKLAARETATPRLASGRRRKKKGRERA